MTDTAALDALIEAVEAGGLPTFPTTCQAVGGNCAENIDGAFNGSLDAAKALHDALLPGWGWETGINATFVSIAQVWKSGREKAYSAQAEDPARAWLLCQLKAHRASL